MLDRTGGLRAMSARYAWVDEIEAWTVALIEGMSAPDVLRLYGGDPDEPVGDHLFWQLGFLRGDDPEDLRFHVQVVDVGGGVVALENGGWMGSHPETARRASAHGGRFFSVYWNVNAFGLVTQAVDGEVTARFEHLYPVAPQEGASEIRPGWAIGDEVGSTLAPRVCLALMEQQTGVQFRSNWLNELRPTYLVPEPHAMFRDVAGADRC